MHNDEPTKVEKQLRPLVPEQRDVDGDAFARWWGAVAQATASGADAGAMNGAAERRQEA